MSWEAAAVVVTVLLAAIAGAIGYGRLQNANEKQAEENENQWTVIERLRAWQTNHEKDSATYRLEFEREMGKLREAIASSDSRYEEIIRWLQSIDKKIDKLEEKS